MIKQVNGRTYDIPEKSIVFRSYKNVSELGPDTITENLFTQWRDKVEEQTLGGSK